MLNCYSLNGFQKVQTSKKISQIFQEKTKWIDTEEVVIHPEFIVSIGIVSNSNIQVTNS